MEVALERERQQALLDNRHDLWLMLHDFSAQHEVTLRVGTVKTKLFVEGGNENQHQ